MLEVTRTISGDAVDMAVSPEAALMAEIKQAVGDLLRNREHLELKGGEFEVVLFWKHPPEQETATSPGGKDAG